MQASNLACIIYVNLQRRTLEIHFQMCRYLAKAAAIPALLGCFGTGRSCSLSNPRLPVRDLF